MGYNVGVALHLAISTAAQSLSAAAAKDCQIKAWLAALFCVCLSVCLCLWAYVCMCVCASESAAYLAQHRH